MSIKQVSGNFRAWLNKHAIKVTAVVLILIVGSMYAIYRETAQPDQRSVPIFNAYFYDLETGKLFVARMSEPSPIPAPGALPGATPTGVKANVFACHTCEDEKDRFVGFVEMYTPEAKARMAAMSNVTANRPSMTPAMLPPRPIAQPTARATTNPTTSPTTSPMMNPPNASFEEMERGHLVAKPDPQNPDWKNQFVEYMSPEGTKIMESAQKKCGDGIYPKICMPEQDRK
jgi:hypothetical protein